MEVKGTAVVAIRDFVKNNYPDQYLDWVDALAPKSKDIYSGVIDATKWYPCDHGAKEPTEKIGQLFFNNDIKNGAWASGRYSADKALTGIYKIFVKAATPSYIIKRASRVFSTYYRPCEISVSKVLDKGVTIEMSKMKVRHEAIEQRINGWMERALELSGCKELVFKSELIRNEEDGNVIEINISWN